MLNKFQKTYLRKLSALELSNKNRQPGKRTCTKYVYISWSFHAQEGWFGALDSQCRPHSHSAPGSWTSPSSIYPPEETSHSWSAHSPTPRLCPGPRRPGDHLPSQTGGWMGLEYCLSHCSGSETGLWPYRNQAFPISPCSLGVRIIMASSRLTPEGGWSWQRMKKAAVLLRGRKNRTKVLWAPFAVLTEP